MHAFRRNEVGEERGDQKMARICYVAALKSGGVGGNPTHRRPRCLRRRKERKLAEVLIPISLYVEEPEKVTHVGALLPGYLKE